MPGSGRAGPVPAVTPRHGARVRMRFGNFKFQYQSEMVFHCRSFIRPPSHQGLLPLYPRNIQSPRILISAHSPGQRPLRIRTNLVVTEAFLPCRRGERGFLREYGFTGKPAQLLAPPSRAGNQAGTRARFRHEQADGTAPLRWARALRWGAERSASGRGEAVAGALGGSHPSASPTRSSPSAPGRYQHLGILSRTCNKNFRAFFSSAEVRIPYGTARRKTTAQHTQTRHSLWSSLPENTSPTG